jgi:hypothetical protein
MATKLIGYRVYFLAHASYFAGFSAYWQLAGETLHAADLVRRQVLCAPALRAYQRTRVARDIVDVTCGARHADLSRTSAEVCRRAQPAGIRGSRLAIIT